MTITEVAAKYPNAWNHPEIVAQLEASAAIRDLPKEKVAKEGITIAYDAARAVLIAYKADLSEPYRYQLALKAADYAFKNWQYLN